MGKIPQSTLYGYAHARETGHSNFFIFALYTLLLLSLKLYYMYNYSLINFLSFDLCGIT